MKNNRIISIWKFVLTISILTLSCSKSKREIYKYEDRVATFLEKEHIATEDVCVFFVKNLECPCFQASLNGLEEYKTSASKKYVFSNFRTDTIPEIISFASDKQFVYEDQYYEKQGLSFVTPKIFVFKKNKVVEWKDYQ